ncbi:hypothetical protein BJ742DRAFT_849906 [Cladochytrium replicatum]|nr:hypothetical protein BJ742DRAFT_849906 [Cladochytrium replicatum]
MPLTRTEKMAARTRTCKKARSNHGCQPSECRDLVESILDGVSTAGYIVVDEALGRFGSASGRNVFSVDLQFLSLPAKHTLSRYIHLPPSLSTEMNGSLFHTDDVEDTSCMSGKGFRSGINRSVGRVLFYVKDWKDGDGDCLRVYPDSMDPTRETESIFPSREGGRMAVFRSDMLHEVLLSYATRFAITMWVYSTVDFL